MDEDEDVLILSSEDEGEGASSSKPRSKLLKRKLSFQEGDLVEQPTEPREEHPLSSPEGSEAGDEIAPTTSFNAGIFDHEEDDDDVEEEVSRVLPRESATMLWMREAGLVVDDERPWCNVPVPVHNSVKAARFKERLDELEKNSPDADETIQHRKTWDAYEAYVQSWHPELGDAGHADILSGSTSNFSTMPEPAERKKTMRDMMASFIDDQAGEEDEEGNLVKHSPNQNTLHHFMRRLRTTGGGPQIDRRDIMERDEYEEDGFVVADDDDIEEEVEPEEKDPSDMSLTELERYRDSKRRKLEDERAELAAKQEELEALQHSIMDQHGIIDDLETLLSRCDKLLSAGKQEDE